MNYLPADGVLSDCMHKYYVINDAVEFHPATSTLSDLNNHDHSVVLNSPAGRCLLLLIERAGTIVTQQEFIDIVWKERGMLVSPNTYYQNICILRKGLKRMGFIDDLIVTIPRIGLTLASNTKIKINENKEILVPAGVNDEAERSEIALVAEPEPENIECVEADEKALPVVADAYYAAPSQIGPRARKRSFLLIPTLITAIALVGVGIMQSQAAYDSQFFNRYRFVENVGGCHFFLTQSLQSPAEKKEALAYGERFKDECVNYPWIYINRYSILPRASVIRCNKPMTEPNYCISDYFIEER